MKAKPQAWTKEQLDYLREITPGTPFKDVTRLLNERFKINRSYKSVETKAKVLGLKNGIDGKFQKNHDPFNKGVPMASWMSPESMERIKATQFKSDKTGQIRGRDRTPGEERINKDGYIEVRLDKPKKTWKYEKSTTYNYWEFKHILIWEKHHNQKVPKGYKVIFADGDKRNFDIDNLVLVSNTELLKLNQNHLYFKGNAELTKTGLNIVKLNILKNKRRTKNEKHAN